MSIMVPLDTSDLSASAIPKAVELAQALDTDVLLVTVVNQGIRSALEEFAEVEGEDPVDIIGSNLRGAARSLSGVRVHTDMLGGDDAASSLIERAGRDDIEMIVIASHGRAGVQRWMMGSVAERVVRGATVPIMVVPAPWRVASRMAPVGASAGEES